MLGRNVGHRDEKQHSISASSRSLSFILPSGIARAMNDEYIRLSREERTSLANIVAQDLSAPDSTELRKRLTAFSAALDTYERDPVNALSDSRLRAAQDALRFSLAPLYLPLLEEMQRENNGIKALIIMRHDAILAAALPPNGISESIYNRDSLRRLSEELAHILRAQYCVSSLVLRRVGTDSPVHLLHRMAEISSLRSPQPVANVEELVSRRMNDESRRIYAFFHARFKNEPLVFVEVAFCSREVRKISEITGTNRSQSQAEDFESGNPTTAVFYSITSSQPGLSGLDLGGNLIKRVMREISKDTSLHGLKNFITMSPIPGFGNWLRRVHSSWTVSDFSREHLMCSAAAYYLVSEKKRGSALDSVANFHLRNGAQIDRIHWNADTSARAVRDGFGIMVTYKYEPQLVEHNSASYILDGRVQRSFVVDDLVQHYRGASLDITNSSDARSSA